VQNKVGIKNRIQALRYQLPKICVAFNELDKEAGDTMIKSKAKTLCKLFKQY
jgi:hypothetical protein